MKLSDPERDGHINDMISLLKDGQLTGDLNAQSTITKLNQVNLYHVNGHVLKLWQCDHVFI